MKKHTSFALGLLALRAAAAGAAAPPSLKGCLDKAMADLDAGGCVAAEVQGGSAHYLSFGDPAPRAGIAPEKVIFEIASITKVFTNLLLAQAVVEHRVALSDPICRYLPPSLIMAPGTAFITLEQLATHTSGLPAQAGNDRPKDRLDPFADYTTDELYAFLRDFHPSPPPHPAVYSNLGAGLLGHILERVYGEPYGDLVASKISGPLGMPDTVVDLDAEQLSRFAVPHSGYLTVEPFHFQALAGAGALHSTAADLARFAEILMAPERDPLRAAWEIERQPRFDFETGKIGLGVFIADRDGRTVFWHRGTAAGFRSYIEWTPGPAPRALVILENGDGFEPYLVAASLHTPERYAPGLNANRPETPLPPGKAGDYVGVYRINERASFTLVCDAAGRLRFRPTGQPFAPIFAAGGDRFFLRSAAEELQFSRGPDGRVNRVTRYMNGRELDAARTDDRPPLVLFPSPRKLGDYVGRYAIGRGFEFEIFVKEDWLFAKITGEPAWPVFSDRPDHFAYDVSASAITFERGPDGAVASLLLEQNGRAIAAEKLGPR